MFFALFESSRAAFASIYAHGLRSFLTTLGIVIGVASVIAVVSVTQGMSAFIAKPSQASAPIALPSNPIRLCRIR